MDDETQPARETTMVQVQDLPKRSSVQGRINSALGLLRNQANWERTPRSINGIRVFEIPSQDARRAAQRHLATTKWCSCEDFSWRQVRDAEEGNVGTVPCKHILAVRSVVAREHGWEQDFERWATTPVSNDPFVRQGS